MLHAFSLGSFLAQIQVWSTRINFVLPPSTPSASRNSIRSTLRQHCPLPIGRGLSLLRQHRPLPIVRRGRYLLVVIAKLTSGLEASGRRSARAAAARFLKIQNPLRVLWYEYHIIMYIHTYLSREMVPDNERRQLQSPKAARLMILVPM